MSNGFGESEKRIDYVFKVVLVGDCHVGKSQLLGRFSTGEYRATVTTIGVERATRTVVVDHKSINAQFWDTSDLKLERYWAFMRNSYYRGAVGAMLVYDITERESFDNVQRWWLKELRAHADSNIVVMLVGNKSELGHLRKVPMEEAKEYAEKEKLFFMETSALEAANVENAFHTVVTEIFRIVIKKALLADPSSVSTSILSGTNTQLPSDDQPETLKGERKGWCAQS